MIESIGRVGSQQIAAVQLEVPMLCLLWCSLSLPASALFSFFFVFPCQWKCHDRGMAVDKQGPRGHQLTAWQLGCLSTLLIATAFLLTSLQSQCTLKTPNAVNLAARSHCRPG